MPLRCARCFGLRVLLGLAGGGMAHFQLAPGAVAMGVRHLTIEDIRYFVAGRGEMWRAGAGGEAVDAVGPGVCLTIPLGVSFQFRSFGPEPLAAIAVAMPPWPGRWKTAPGRRTDA